ncbi:hypothetical protein Patl1_12719 [Pistacia atlantica]|uniref:Uncharacterized protein n=1 Tax=Pistacia atlantica TaxID=434234 RepID=A0ACC1AWE0_9ROSI|nr:hypothetical protein Patl1_12719 [Pistacia atlantica]
MNPKASSLILVTLFVFFISVNVESFDVTELLNRYPDLIGFNDLLTQTKIAESIANRRTITILAVDNSSLAGIQSRPIDEVQKILSDHVILDYYDMKKLRKLQKSVIVTTLYQTTGVAEKGQGFLNVTHMPGEQFVFGSAVKGAVPVAKLVKAVYAQPFNVSVLQVSQPIVAPGIGEVILPPPPPPYIPPPAQPPKSSTSSNKTADSPGSDEDEIDAPNEAPVEAPAPAPVDAPDEAPVSSPPAPTKEETPVAPASGASRVYEGLSFVVAAFVALVF